jgi:hypothetical protein
MGSDGLSGSDQQWDEAERDETAVQRLDRNWGDLLQELRVVQTGVQLLTGFLLTLPFQTRFEKLTTFQTNTYLCTLAASVIATGLLIAPVSVHRLLFRQHARKAMVGAAHRLALAGISFLGLAVVGVVLLIFEVVSDRMSGVIAACFAAVLLLLLWTVLPLVLRHRHQD